MPLAADVITSEEAVATVLRLYPCNRDFRFEKSGRRPCHRNRPLETEPGWPPGNWAELEMAPGLNGTSWAP